MGSFGGSVGAGIGQLLASGNWLGALLLLITVLVVTIVWIRVFGRPRPPPDKPPPGGH